METLDLAQLGTDTTKILTQLQRATRARYRYVHLCNEQGVKVDPAVDHQLMDHVQLIESLASLAGVDREKLDDTLRGGIAQARAEA